MRKQPLIVVAVAAVVVVDVVDTEMFII